MFADALPVRFELIDFQWEVARDGYRVVRVRPEAVGHTNAEAPDLPLGTRYETLADNDDSDTGYVAPDEELITAATAEPLWVRPYLPLTDEPALFRTFSDVDTSPGALVSFAGRYGLLGGSVGRRFVVPGSDQPGEGEPVQTWRDEIAAIRRVVQAWDAAREDDPEGRPRWQRPQKVRKIMREGQCQNVVQRLDALLGSHLLPNVQRAVNARLTAETGARMLWNPTEGRLRLHLRPASLLGALWLQLAQAIDGNARYRRCQVCTAWFELHPDRARTNRVYCSNACRFKAYRGRQGRARELRSGGMDPEAIASELGSDVETIKKWTGGSDG